MNAANGAERTRTMFATGVTRERLPNTRERLPKGNRPRPQATPETIDTFTLAFEGISCGKCAGSGRIPQFGHVRRGMCFGCEGTGARFTPRGRAARARFDALCAESLPVLREEIRPGDRVWYRMRGLGAWVPVTGVHDDARPGETRIGIGDDVRVYRYPSNLRLDLDHPAGVVGVWGPTGQGYTIPRWDPGRVTAIVNEIAAMPGALLRQTGGEG